MTELIFCVACGSILSVLGGWFVIEVLSWWLRLNRGDENNWSNKHLRE